MKERVLDTIREYGMISPGQSVLVGVSGGADSMCLLSVLTELSAVLRCTVAAAHVNHGIRGEEADRDEEFVRRFCRERDIPFYCARPDIPALARSRGESTELCARKERYAYFSSLGFDRIATAHTGSDAVETMLMNLSRGAALKGLCSIPPVRGQIIRPLIGLLREDTEAYCARHGIDYVTDSTNLTDEYTRNRYRHRVIPALREINPSFEKNALRCISSLRQEEAYLSREAQKLFASCFDGTALDAEILSGIDGALRCRVLALYLEKLTAADYEFRHIRYAAERTDACFAVVLPGGECLSGDGKRISIRREDRPEHVPGELILNKNFAKMVSFGNFSVEIKVSRDNIADKSTMVVDFSKIDDIIKIRSRTAGDMLALPKRRCAKTLKKLFNELKIPPQERSGIPVLADSRGVIAVGGISADASRLPDEKTEKILIIKTECGKNDK